MRRLPKRTRQRIVQIGVWVFLVLFVLSITTGLILMSRTQAPGPTPITSPAY